MSAPDIGPRYIPPATRAAIHRRFERDLEAWYPGYKFHIPDDEPSVAADADADGPAA